MSEKRLTKKDKYGHWYTETKINDRFMWSKDGKVWERDLYHYAFDGEAIDRLAEFEDKKESGQYVGLPCVAYNVKECKYQIISTKNGRVYASKFYRDRKEAEARLKELQEGK